MFSLTTVSDAFESHAVFTRGIQSSLGSPIAKRAKQMKLNGTYHSVGKFRYVAIGARVGLLCDVASKQP